MYMLTLNNLEINFYGFILTAAHWVTGTDTVLHRETGGGKDVRGISGVHTCVGVIVTDTVGDVRVEVSDVQGERRSPGEDLVVVIVVLRCQVSHGSQQSWIKEGNSKQQ